MFGCIFYRKLFPKWAISSCSSPPLPHFFATFSEGRFLNAFWSPFGSLWTPFGCILVEFWLPFTCLWLPFGSLLVPFGSLLVPLSLDFPIFGGSWRHSSYLCFGTHFGFILDPFSAEGCPIPRDPLACKLAFQGPEREYCRRQLRYDF